MIAIRAAANLIINKVYTLTNRCCKLGNKSFAVTWNSIFTLINTTSCLNIGNRNFALGFATGVINSGQSQCAIGGIV